MLIYTTTPVYIRESSQALYICMRTRRQYWKNQTQEDMTKRAILYVRVSTEGQVDNTSLEAQRARLIEEAERRGLESLVLEDGGQSAKNTDRPAFQEALQMLSAGEAQVLMVAKLDRLSRSLQDVLDLASRAEREGWDIVVLDGSVQFDSGTPNGKLQLRIIASLAEWERDTIRQRVITGIERQRERGDEGYIPASLEAQIVELYRSGLSMARIAEKLNAEGVETAKGGKWYASTVKRVTDRAERRQREGV